MTSIRHIIASIFQGQSGVMFAIASGHCPGCLEKMRTIKMMHGYFYTICLNCGYDIEIRDCKKSSVLASAARIGE